LKEALDGTLHSKIVNETNPTVNETASSKPIVAGNATNVTVAQESNITSNSSKSDGGKLNDQQVAQVIDEVSTE